MDRGFGNDQLTEEQRKPNKHKIVTVQVSRPRFAEKHKGTIKARSGHWCFFLVGTTLIILSLNIDSQLIIFINI